METLADRIAREGPVNELDAVGWVVRLAKKLEMLHSRGLAHGGISPEAMKTASASRLSLGMLVPMGAARNRLEFRSPERLDRDAASAADDTWSAAVTLYALLTGSSPFVAGDDDAIRQRIRSGSFSPLSSFEVGDEDLQHLLEAALHPSLKNRTSTIVAFREALEAWHPDPKVRELPPMADDQPDDDDEDERTVMRPVSAADAVRNIIAQREQGAAQPPQATLPNARLAPPVAQAPAPAHAHGLMEDDDENAKTSLISVPPMAMLNAIRGPATVPAPPPPGAIALAPPVPPTTGTGLSMQRAPAPGGRPSLAKQTVLGGFAPAAVHQPVAPPTNLGISRDAVIDDGEGDSDATVMREAPAELLQQAKASIAPPAQDRKTPVDPTSAAVAATTVDAAEEAPKAPVEMQSLFEDDTQTGKVIDPKEASSSAEAAPKVVDEEEFNATVAYAPPRISAPPPAPERTSSPSNPSMPARISIPTPAPAPIIQNAPQQPLPAPIVPSNPPSQPNPLKGLLIGVGLALVLIAGAAAFYFLVLKR